MYIDRKIVKHYNKRRGKIMRNFMVAYVRVVKKMARENGCWVTGKKRRESGHKLIKKM